METTTLIILMAAALVILTIVVGMLALRLFHKNDELKEKNDVIVREVRRNQQLIDRAVQNGVNRAAMLTVVVLLCGFSLTAQAQTMFCTSYADYKAGNWKPYEDLIPGKEPDSIRVKYNGQDFTLKTSDKEVNKAIKHDVFMMQIETASRLRTFCRFW